MSTIAHERTINMKTTKMIRATTEALGQMAYKLACLPDAGKQPGLKRLLASIAPRQARRARFDASRAI